MGFEDGGHYTFFAIQTRKIHSDGLEMNANKSGREYEVSVSVSKKISTRHVLCRAVVRIRCAKR
jgi:hypothetical protein